jgi:raffinose/stachyose/melibiose transport system substrate-binding protein
LGSFYVENGMTADLTATAKAENWAAKYNAASLSLSSYGGKLSGVPFHLNAIGLYYPKPLFGKLGIKEPKTFADFEASLKVLSANKAVPLAFAGKNGWHLMRLTEALIEHFGGPQVHDDLLALKTSWNNPAVTKTFAKLKEWSDLGYFPKGFIALDTQEVENQQYPAGKMGYNLEGPWYDGNNIAAAGFDPKDFAVIQFPTDQNPVRISSFAEMFQVSAQSSATQRAAALKLAKYITGLEAATKYVDDYGAAAILGGPVSKKSPNTKVISDLVSKGNFLIGDQALPQEVVQKLFEATDKVVLKVWTPEQGAAAIQAAAEAFKKK